MEQLILTDFFTTKEEANDFSARISTVIDSVYEVNFNMEKTLVENFGIKKKDKIMSLLRENGISPEASSESSKFFSRIKEIISTLPVVNLTLAIEPDNETLKSIADWFMLNLKHQVLIDFSVDASLIGGAVIDFNGKHSDASLRPEFEKVCSDLTTNPK